ncbi:hypothetical protein EXV95_07920 [Acidovorax sp. JMULE5]|uniref:hypothetical protein n=1 Tax=Acidovorax sp. JMULE5 TaxID=2518343 RepID=UPI0015A21630|nr:hypothetical protein [Acidovorax sp. JMULE5]QLA80570.1 hypothetical protein EXV95_07920 [Acidovorax sp. JMULE5]
MGIVKAAMAEEESKRQTAVEILMKVGFLDHCEHHEEIIFTVGGDEEVTGAYKYGNANWTAYQGSFKDRKDMTDHIKQESENSDYANDGCEICRSMFEKD